MSAELLRSLSRFSWALSLFGARQMVHGYASLEGERSPARMVEAFDAVTDAAERHLEGVLRQAFRAADPLQRSAVDCCTSALTPESFTPRGLTRAFLVAAQQSARAVGRLVPGEGNRLAWQELQNKLEAFDLFEHVDTALDISAASRTPLAELVDRAAAFEPYRAVWAMEGLGHHAAETEWQTGAPPEGLLAGDPAARLPERCLIPLHAGLGLSLAHRVLATAGGAAQAEALRRALLRVVALCRSNSRDGYVGAAYEAVGLVARNLYPHMVRDIGRLLPEIDQELPSYFWHGVGRAIYFAPTHALPRVGAATHAVETVRREAPEGAPRANALAGLAWAVTLVNIRHPQVLQAFLRQSVREGVDEDALANGVASALLVWRAAAPGDASLERLCRDPAPSPDPAVADVWHRLVAQPFAAALREEGPHAALHPGDLFRYRPAAEGPR